MIRTHSSIHTCTIAQMLSHIHIYIHTRVYGMCNAWTNNGFCHSAEMSKGEICFYACGAFVLCFQTVAFKLSVYPMRNWESRMELLGKISFTSIHSGSTHSNSVLIYLFSFSFFGFLGKKLFNLRKTGGYTNNQAITTVSLKHIGLI